MKSKTKANTATFKDLIGEWLVDRTFNREDLLDHVEAELREVADGIKEFIEENGGYEENMTLLVGDLVAKKAVRLSKIAIDHQIAKKADAKKAAKKPPKKTR